tara:strand:+ start:4763 stop:5530 length:768 start_codon:yes stop_codon:yes gene_type:complete
MANSLPWMKFYPSDWLSDAGVRGCPLAARGLWIDMLCLMWASPQRGYLLHPSGTAVLDQELAGMVGETPGNVRRGLESLDRIGVLSRTDEGVAYNRRMVREESARVATRGRVVKHRSNADVTPLVTVQRSEVRDQRSEVRTKAPPKAVNAPEFDAFWEVYPRKTAKAEARKSWGKALAAAGGEFEAIVQGAKDYAASDIGRGETRFIAYPATWLNQERWADDRAAWATNSNGTPQLDHDGIAREVEARAAREAQG